MEAVKDFYSQLQFPGTYTLNDLEFYGTEIYNNYLKLYDEVVKESSTVLDVGCGSGFILNLLAIRHPSVQFTAVDFSDSIDYAEQFARSHNITNITFYKTDFLTWDTCKTYDTVISNGVVHHIPEYNVAIEKIKTLSKGTVAIGVYNTYGKLHKKFAPVKYIDNILYLDQEHCPFEVSFTDKEFRRYFKEYELVKTTPGYKNRFIDFYNLFNSSNGGLTVYVFKLIV